MLHRLLSYKLVVAFAVDAVAVAVDVVAVAVAVVAVAVAVVAFAVDAGVAVDSVVVAAFDCLCD